MREPVQAMCSGERMMEITVRESEFRLGLNNHNNRIICTDLTGQ